MQNEIYIPNLLRSENIRKINSNDEESINYINMFMISYNQVIDNCKEKRNIDDSDIKEIEKLIS